MDNILRRFGIEKQQEEGIGGDLIRFLRKLWRIYGMIRTEFRSKVSLSIWNTLRGWRYGFLRWSYFLYELDKNDPRMFVNEYVQRIKMGDINGLHRQACAQKVIFSKYVESLGASCPRIHALIVKGRIYVLDGTEQAGIEWLFKLIEEYPSGVVLKPMLGCEGFGIAFLKRNEQSCELNGRTATYDDVKNIVKQLNDYLITDFITQHEYAAGLYPRTTNTLRLLTLWDYETNWPFLAAAVQRIGNSRSYPVDNFKMGAGGLSALVDSETGKLGCGAYRPDKGPMQRHARHPETGGTIEGICVPRWRETVEDILQFSARLPYLPLIGWDVVITPNAYQIIETNPGSGLFVIQVHLPLLADRRVKRFFEIHNCNRGCS